MSSMDWAKILLCLYLATSSTVSLKTENSETESSSKEGKIISNDKSLNSTQNTDEILEESPSEVIRFQNPVIFREQKGTEKIKQDSEKTKSIKQKKEEAKDLVKEANEYRAVLTFSETPGSMIEGHWQIIPEMLPHWRQNEFISSVPVIDSQSFANKPKMSSQLNYSPPRYFEGRNANSDSREYSSDQSSYEGHRYPESGNDPVRGHSVHTETSHDFGRFLPEDYRSQIEQEAEALIKHKKVQNVTLTSTEAPRISKSINPQRSPGHYQKSPRSPGHYQKSPKPLNTAFFHKGGFEDAYPFPDSHDNRGHTYTSEEYPKQQYMHAPKEKEPTTYISNGDTYRQRQPVTSTESYQTQYSSEQYPPPPPPHGSSPHHENRYHRGPQNKHPPHSESYSGDRFHHTDSHNSNPHHADVYGGGAHHADSYNEGPHNMDAPNRGAYYSDVQNKKSQHENKYYSNPHHISNHNSQQHEEPHHRNLPSAEYHYPSPPNAPREYISSTEKYTPTHAGIFRKPYSETTSSKPKQYNPPTEQQHLYYKNEGEKFPSSYTSNNNEQSHHADPPSKKYPVPYSNSPSVASQSEPYSPSSPPPQDAKYQETDSVFKTHSNNPIAKTELEMEQEKAYYNTFKSLMDLYKSFGLEPFKYDDTPILPPRFPFGDPFEGKIEVAGPTSSEDFHGNSKPPIYSGSYESPGDQSHNSYHEPYPPTSYNSNEHGSSNVALKDTSAAINTNPYYPVPYDSNPAPFVSTEHYDISENSKPGVFNTQVESPKGTLFKDEFATKFPPDSKYTPTDSGRIRGIRIKDFDRKTFFGGPEKKNLYNSAEPQYSSSASLTEAPLNSHSVVRKNPYNIQSPNSAEEITYRPRFYRQKLTVEAASATTDSEERTNNNFYADEKTNKFRPPEAIDNSTDVTIDSARNIRPAEHFDVHSKYQQNQHNHQTSEKSKNPPNKDHQLRSNSRKKSKTRQTDYGERSTGEQEHRQGKRKKRTQNSEKIPFQGEYTYSDPEQRSKFEHHENHEYRSKRHRKRSSQRSPKKHKPDSKRDVMRAEGSTYHWGMERHKGTNGFFQYLNVPGAKAYEYGYRMGGPEHTEEQHHRRKGRQSQIKINWEDGNGDSGDHYWEFNHNSKEDDSEEPKLKISKETVSKESLSEEQVA